MPALNVDGCVIGAPKEGCGIKLARLPPPSGAARAVGVHNKPPRLAPL
jgi:hypothetical protein